MCFFALSPLAVKILYAKLSIQNQTLVINMLKLSSLSIIFLPLMQTLNAILIGVGNPHCCMISGATACTVKLLLSYNFLKFRALNVFAVIISDIVCYLLACLINLVYIIKGGVRVKSCILRRQYE